MHEVIRNSNSPSEQGTDSEHLILTLVEKESLDVFMPAPGAEISPGQLFIVDCRNSTPQQVQNWYVGKPESIPFLLLSPEKEHVLAMADVCILSLTQAYHAVLYEHTTDDKVSITCLPYAPPRKGEEPTARIEPTADCGSTKIFMEAACRSLKGPIKLDVTYPSDPPQNLICSAPAGIITTPYSVVYDMPPYFEGGETKDNKSATTLTLIQTPYAYLQQLGGGSENNQFLIVSTQWIITAGKLYSDTSTDRGNAQCNMRGTMQPSPYTSFYASAPPNDFSPKSSDDGSFDASMNQIIYYYDGKQQLSYKFFAETTYDIEDWAVSSICKGTALGANFYATKPTDCENYPKQGSAFDSHHNVYPLSPASSSGGVLNFTTYSSWQTETNKLVKNTLNVFASYTANIYDFYYDDDDPDHGIDEFTNSNAYIFSPGFTVDFSGIQPPNQ